MFIVFILGRLVRKWLSTSNMKLVARTQRVFKVKIIWQGFLCDFFSYKFESLFYSLQSEPRGSYWGMHLHMFMMFSLSSTMLQNLHSFFFLSSLYLTFCCNIANEILYELSFIKQKSRKHVLGKLSSSVLSSTHTLFSKESRTSGARAVVAY